MSADEFVERVASLPLAFQPGAGWLYETGIDLLGMLLIRATGRSLADLVAERITGPLGMASTGFRAPDAARLATAYMPGPDGLDGARPAGRHLRRPAAVRGAGFRAWCRPRRTSCASSPRWPTAARPC